MKKTLVLLFLLSTTIALSQEWQWQNPYPFGCTFRHLQIMTPTVAYALGDYGTYIKTTDGGITWKPMLLPDSLLEGISCYYFLNEDTGFVAYRNQKNYYYILKTTDGGKNWESKFSTSSNYIMEIKFYNNQIGYAGGSTVYRTSDGGETWGGTYFPQGEGYGIYVYDENTVASVGWDYVRMTTDGGLTVRNIFPNGHFRRLSIVNKDTLFLLGNFVCRTTDNGKTWDSLVINNDDPNLFSYFNDIWFSSDSTGFIVGGTTDMRYPNWHGTDFVMKTTNCGNTWNKVPPVTDQAIECIAFSGSQKGIALGYFGLIMETSDGGDIWNIRSKLVTRDTLLSIYVIDAENAFACGHNGAIIHTTNAGKDWVTQKTNTPSILRSISFADKMNGIAAGDNASIFYTTNGGDNWNKSVYVFYGAVYNSVSYIKNTATAYICTPLCKTTNSGQRWEIINDYADFNSISFVSIDTGYSAGNGIMKTIDGGITWNDLKVPGTFKFITFCNSNFGAASSETKGIIYLTSDGGVTWNQVNIDSTMQIMGLSFTDSNYLTVILGGGYSTIFKQNSVTTSGKIYRSTDRGKSWTVQNIPGYIINNVDYFDKNLGFAVGNDGAIIQTDNTTVPVELASFTLSAKDNEVKLLWQTASETNNKGFEVERKSRDRFESIQFIAGYGTSTERKYYSYTDKKLAPGKYIYRIKQMDYDGSFSYSKELTYETDLSSLQYSLSECYPNPFNPVTKIKYTIPVKENVSLKIFDIMGSEVTELFNGLKQPGIYEAEWNAASFASGVYFYQLKSGTYNKTRKMILLK